MTAGETAPTIGSSKKLHPTTMVKLLYSPIVEGRINSIELTLKGAGGTYQPTTNRATFPFGELATSVLTRDNNLSLMDDLASVSANLADDLEVTNDPDNYSDPLPPAPVAEGNYRLRLEVALDKNQDGSIRGQKDDKGKFYPTILIKKGVVVEGPAGTIDRTGISFARVYTKPFPRGDGQANGLADLTRAFDQTRGWNNFEDGFRLLEELTQTATMRCRLVWEAFDTDHYNALLGQMGKTKDQLTPAEKKQLNKDCTIKGAKNFDKNGIAKGKSGATLTARTRIGSTYPSSENVKIG